MEDLNKTQIILLAILISFVTSIATGIVTVTLMDQAPPAVVRTINRVVEKTIQTVVPGKSKVTTVVKEVVVKQKDLIVGAVAKASKSIAIVDAVGPDNKKVFLGLGVVMSGNGYVVVDKSRISGNRNNLILSVGDKSMGAKVVVEKKDFVILKAGGGIPVATATSTPSITPITTSTVKNNSKATNKNSNTKTTDAKVSLTPVSLVDSSTVKLGQSVLALGGTMGGTVFTGIVSKLEMGTLQTSSTKTTSKTKTDKKITFSMDSKILEYIVPSFDVGSKSAGGPLLDTEGNLLGINVITADGKVLAVPSNQIKKALSSIGSISKSTTIGDKNMATVAEGKTKKVNLTNSK